MLAGRMSTMREPKLGKNAAKSTTEAAHLIKPP
jgi:hypothetical protein